MTVQQRSALITWTKLLIAKAKLETQSATIVERGKKMLQGCSDPHTEAK